MSRLTVAVDRFVVLVLALVLIVGGAGSAVWGTKQVSRFEGPIDLSPLTHATNQTWWPWAIGVGGGVLVLLAIRWLVSHLPRRGIGPLKLRGTGRDGRLVADGRSVADAAAQALAVAPGVRSAHGRVLSERGQLVARLDATIEPDADLAVIAQSADEVSAQLRHVLGRDDLNCLVQLRLATRGRTSRRRVE